jgi:hypothetical protein
MKRCAIGLSALLLAPAAPAAQGGAVPAPDPVATVFAAWDRDGDGRLSLAEFRAGREQAQAIARAQAALARRFAAIDADHDRAIDAREYANLALVEQAGKAAPPLARFDADGDGRLEFAEYARLVATLAPREAPRADAKK